MVIVLHGCSCPGEAGKAWKTVQFIRRDVVAPMVALIECLPVPKLERNIRVAGLGKVVQHPRDALRKRRDARLSDMAQDAFASSILLGIDKRCF